jgi:hypothetical protein
MDAPGGAGAPPLCIIDTSRKAVSKINKIVVVYLTK